MVLGSLGCWWALMIDCRALLASPLLEVLRGRWVVMLVGRFWPIVFEFCLFVLMCLLTLEIYNYDFNPYTYFTLSRNTVIYSKLCTAQLPDHLIGR